ncbi:unnamed protein product [Ixodes pacificus]
MMSDMGYHNQYSSWRDLVGFYEECYTNLFATSVQRTSVAFLKTVNMLKLLVYVVWHFKLIVGPWSPILFCTGLKLFKLSIGVV